MNKIFKNITTALVAGSLILSGSMVNAQPYDEDDNVSGLIDVDTDKDSELLYYDWDINVSDPDGPYSYYGAGYMTVGEWNALMSSSDNGVIAYLRAMNPDFSDTMTELENDAGEHKMPSSGGVRLLLIFIRAYEDDLVDIPIRDISTSVKFAATPELYETRQTVMVTGVEQDANGTEIRSYDYSFQFGTTLSTDSDILALNNMDDTCSFFENNVDASEQSFANDLRSLVNSIEDTTTMLPGGSRHIDFSIENTECWTNGAVDKCRRHLTVIIENEIESVTVKYTLFTMEHLSDGSATGGFFAPRTFDISYEKYLELSTSSEDMINYIRSIDSGFDETWGDILNADTIAAGKTRYASFEYATSLDDFENWTEYEIDISSTAIEEEIIVPIIPDPNEEIIVDPVPVEPEETETVVANIVTIKTEQSDDSEDVIQMAKDIFRESIVSSQHSVLFTEHNRTTYEYSSWYIPTDETFKPWVLKLIVRPGIFD